MIRHQTFEREIFRLFLFFCRQISAQKKSSGNHKNFTIRWRTGGKNRVGLVAAKQVIPISKRYNFELTIKCLKIFFFKLRAQFVHNFFFRKKKKSANLAAIIFSEYFALHPFWKIMPITSFNAKFFFLLRDLISKVTNFCNIFKERI